MFITEKFGVSPQNVAIMNVNGQPTEMVNAAGFYELAKASGTAKGLQFARKVEATMLRLAADAPLDRSRLLEEAVLEVLNFQANRARK